MLRFFRQIRKKLIEQSQIRKYLLYALGEILLVVIGILIALQVNTWNQNRLDRIEERKMLANIHDEFVQNKKLLNTSLSTTMDAYEAGITLMALMGQEHNRVMQHNLDSLLYHMLPADDYLPSNNSINNIIQSGRLNLITNDELIELLYEWEVLVGYIKDRDTSSDKWVNEQVLIFLADYISFKEMDIYGGFEWTGRSNLSKDYYPLFESLAFENILDNTLYLYRQQIERLEQADELINKIIEMTKSD